MTIIDGGNANYLKVDDRGGIQVDQLDQWIDALIIHNTNNLEDGFLRVVDSKTGATYLIKKVDDLG